MPTFVQTSKTPGQIFGGGTGNDYLVGNATPGTIYIGGDKDDTFAPGIVTSTDPADRITIYGDGVLDGFNQPFRFVYDKPGSIAHRARAGNDNIAIGQNITAKGGAGFDTYTDHGGQDADRPELYAVIGGFDTREDTLIFDHSEGWRVDTMKVGQLWTTNGTHFAKISAFTLHGDSDNPVVGTEDQDRGQHIRVNTIANGHDPDFHSYVVDYDSGTWQDALRADIAQSFGTGALDYLR